MMPQTYPGDCRRMTELLAAAPLTENAAKQAAVSGGPFGIKGLAWAIFEGARNPYYNLIVIYIFAPYFAEVMVGGGELGLTLSGLTITMAGIVTALTAPFLGVVADKPCSWRSWWCALSHFGGLGPRVL
jgi:UMF1 family MFS transporter